MWKTERERQESKKMDLRIYQISALGLPWAALRSSSGAPLVQSWRASEKYHADSDSSSVR